MKIGIDIDDTVTYTTEYLKKYKQKYAKEYKLDYHAFSKEELMDFYKKYGKKVYADIEYKPGAVKYIQKLKKEGNEIYFITARNKEYCEDMEKYTFYSFKKNKMPYDGIMFDAEDKAAATKNLGLQVFVDDRVKILDQFENSEQNIYLIQMLKEGSKPSEYVKAKNWKVAYKLINKYKEEMW